MASDLAVAVVSGLSSGGFALLGVGISEARARRREREAFSRETVLELAGMERHIWGENWVELQAHLQRQEARLRVAAVPEDLVDAFGKISEACWRDQQEILEASAGEKRGIRSSLLDARRVVHGAVRAQLLGEPDRGTQRASRHWLVSGVPSPPSNAVSHLGRSDHAWTGA